jgi:hypothetical protein
MQQIKFIFDDGEFEYIKTDLKNIPNLHPDSRLTPIDWKHGHYNAIGYCY